VLTEINELNTLHFLVFGKCLLQVRIAGVVSLSCTVGLDTRSVRIIQPVVCDNMCETNLQCPLSVVWLAPPFRTPGHTVTMLAQRPTGPTEVYKILWPLNLNYGLIFEIISVHCIPHTYYIL
jgi:hypothetical protein